MVDKEGTIVTNAHVVEGADSVTVRFDEKGDRIDAKVRGRDPSTDLAVLKIDPAQVDGLQPLPLGDSNDVKVGDPTIAIGNPFGLSRTVTTGIVSAKQRQIEAPNGFQISNVIQTDASINPGNSGGPLLDAAGRVIGINSQIATGSGGSGSVGIGFAVPVDTAKKLLPSLREGERIERGYLGVEMAPVTESIASELKLPVDQGALLQAVVPDGPADKAGLRGGRRPTSEGIRAGGDLIVKVDGKEVKDPDDVAAAIEGRRPGDKVQIEYYRGDERKTVTVTLTKRPAKLSSPSSQQRAKPAPHALVGVTSGRDPGQGLWHHPARGRGGGRSARRLGAGHDLLASEPPGLHARGRRGDRPVAQAHDRGGRRVRQRDARRGGLAGRPLLAHHAPAARRRGPGLLPRGRAAHGLQGDEGGERQARGLGGRPARVPDRLPPARRPRAGLVAGGPDRASTGSWPAGTGA